MEQKNSPVRQSGKCRLIASQVTFKVLLLQWSGVSASHPLTRSLTKPSASNCPGQQTGRAASAANFRLEHFVRENRTTFSEVSMLPEFFHWIHRSTYVPLANRPQFSGNFLFIVNHLGHCCDVVNWCSSSKTFDLVRSNIQIQILQTGLHTFSFRIH